jgi:hypothetical protein
MEDNIYTPGQETTDSSPLPIPQITLETLGFLSTIAKWAKFIAIMGFIVIGIMLFFGLGAIFSKYTYASTYFQHFWFGVLYYVIAVVYVFPFIYLNKFSNNMSKAVALRDTELLTFAMEYLKKHYKYMGILIIVTIGTYIIVLPTFFFLATSLIHPQHVNIVMPN